MDQTQMIAQQTPLSNQYYGTPQCFAPLPPVPMNGFTPMFIQSPMQSPMLPPLQNSLPFQGSPFVPVMNDYQSEPTYYGVPNSVSPPLMSPQPVYLIQNSPSPLPAIFVPSLQTPQPFHMTPNLLPPTPFISASRSLSPSTESMDCCGEFTRERTRSLSVDSGEKSKKELVDEALAELSKDFGPNFDTDGLRGQNILRIKVKTRVALENIVEFIRFCQTENLLQCVSCPISTKKGRQHVRGFLAYLQTRNEQDSDRVCELFDHFNATHNNPFKAYQRNPKSTLYKNMGAAA